MRIELEIQKVNVKFVAINDITASDPTDQQQLVKVCSFPLFQDTQAMSAWVHHDGGKDDFYIYDSQGKLAIYLAAGGAKSTDLSTTEGYDNLKQAILSVK